MFVLREVSDDIRIAPHLFHLDSTQAITDFLNKKLANKVVPYVGLFIVLWDIIEIGKSFIFHGDGASHTKVKFRYVVFRPFIDEIMLGKIKSCSKEGVHVTLGFYDDILIPAENLPEPSVFDDAEQTWAWQYEMEGETHNLYMDVGEAIRFRVVEERFEDQSPPAPDPNAPVGGEPHPLAANRTPPYSITASISESGLGLISWWEKQQ